MKKMTKIMWIEKKSGNLGYNYDYVAKFTNEAGIVLRNPIFDDFV